MKSYKIATFPSGDKPKMRLGLVGTESALNQGPSGQPPKKQMREYRASNVTIGESGIQRLR